LAGSRQVKSNLHYNPNSEFRIFFIGGGTDMGDGICCGICLSRMLDLSTRVSPQRAYGFDRALQRGDGELMK